MNFNVLSAAYAPKWTCFPPRACGHSLLMNLKKHVLSQRTFLSAQCAPLFQNHFQTLGKTIHNMYIMPHIWNHSPQNTTRCTPLLLACSNLCANADIYLWVFFRCCQDSETFCLSQSPRFSGGLKSPPVFWQYQQMKDATWDPSVNAQKSDCFMWAHPCYSIYRVDREKNNLKELGKFKTVFRSVLSFQKTH